MKDKVFFLMSNSRCRGTNSGLDLIKDANLEQDQTDIFLTFKTKCKENAI